MQSNLCTTASLGTLKFRPLLIGNRCSEVAHIINIKLGLSKGGLCRHDAFIQRWSLAQVWLYFNNKKLEIFLKWKFQVLLDWLNIAFLNLRNMRKEIFSHSFYRFFFIQFSFENNAFRLFRVQIHFIAWNYDFKVTVALRELVAIKSMVF